MTKTKRGVGGSFTSCFDKTLCFCVMQSVLWTLGFITRFYGTREPSYLLRIIPAIVTTLWWWPGDQNWLRTRICRLCHSTQGPGIHAGYMSQRCNGAGHLIPVKCQLCFSWNQFHTQTTRLSRDMSPYIVIMFMLFECGFARINRRPIRRYNLPGRPGVPKLPDTEVERCILSDLRQL